MQVITDTRVVLSDLDTQANDVFTARLSPRDVEAFNLKADAGECYSFHQGTDGRMYAIFMDPRGVPSDIFAA